MAAAGVDVSSISADWSQIPPAITVNCPADQLDLARAIAAAFDWSETAERSDEEAAEPDLADLLTKAQQATDAISAYLAIADTATAAQVRAEVKAIDQRQRVIIVALARAIRKILIGNQT